MANPTAKQIWDKLSKVNVNAHTKEKMGLTYLSWSWAYTIMMEHYPEFQLTWQGHKDKDDVLRDVMYYEGGTASVHCTIAIGEVTKFMWYSVNNFKNEAIVHPDAMAINTAKMRCMTKCLSLFGLGAYIYAGEDLPVQPVQEATANGVSKPKKMKPVQKNTGASDDVAEKIVILKKTINRLAEGGWDIKDEKLQKEIKKAITDRDGTKVTTLTENIQALGQQALQLSEDN